MRSPICARSREATSGVKGDPKGHPEYALTEERENRIRADIEGMVLDAHPQLVRRMRESLAQREE